MKSIDKTYLVDILFTALNPTIQVRRAAQKKQFFYLQKDFVTANDDEMEDFIASIPYFDAQLKAFILGNSNKSITIISSGWEKEFVLRCKLWAQTDDWLYNQDRFGDGTYQQIMEDDIGRLTLPY